MLVNVAYAMYVTGNLSYAGTDTTFMVNLLPSYASDFNGNTNWWESSIESLDKNAYKNYLQTYCDTVLSQVQGEKWLSMDWLFSREMEEAKNG